METIKPKEPLTHLWQDSAVTESKKVLQGETTTVHGGLGRIDACSGDSEECNSSSELHYCEMSWGVFGFPRGSVYYHDSPLA